MLLFNITCTHYFVPDDFGISTVVPLVKDKLGDTDVNNYSCISLSAVISKVFERCLLNKFQTFIY